MNRIVSSLFIGIALTAGCGNEGQPEEVDRRDASNGTADSTNGQTEPEREFIVDVVEGLGSDILVGPWATARVAPSGRPAVVYGYFGLDQTEIHYAELGPDTTWNVEVAAVPGENSPEYIRQTLFGVGFDFVDGVPTIAYAGGDDDGTDIETGGNDGLIDVGLGDLYTSARVGGQWQATMRVNGSAEAGGVCLDDKNYCSEGNQGFVGLYAHLKAGPQPGQYAISYRDQHFGFGSEDLIGADLEIWEAGPGSQHLMVDGGRSAGNRSSIAFFDDGRSAVAYTLDRPEDRISVMVAIESEGDYERYRVSEDGAQHRLSLDIDSNGTLWLAYFDANDVDLVVASSSDEGETWDVERVEQRGDTGLYPSLAVDGDDNVLVAYTYCGEASDRDCPGQLGRDSVVRLATRRAGSSEWEFQDIDNGQGQGFVGEFNSLVTYPDGTIGVAFADQRNSDLLFAREIQ